MGGDFEVLHYSEFLMEIAPKLATTTNDGNPDKIAFHDSCYLGRYNNIFDAPREVLDLAGAERFELPRHGENSYCCGAGGGGMWVETDPDTRINQNRLQQALDVGAKAVATACPYCLIMLEDAIRSKGVGEEVKVYDIAEVLDQQIQQ